MSTDRAARESFAQQYIDTLCAVLRAIPAAPVGELLNLMHEARARGATVFIAGNGGSAATASHMACDLVRTIAKGGKPPLRTVALTDNVSLITALANDESYDEAFAGQLRSLGGRDDVLLVISASGNSPSVLKAVACAKELRMKTAGLLGMGGGAAASLVDIAVVVPSSDYGPVEDAHVALNHVLTAFLSRF